MSLKLYFAPGACSFVPHALLEASGEGFEPVMVKLHKGEQQGEAFKAINPRSQVPVLVDGEEVITQIVAIVTHLDQRFPALEFLPRAPIERVRALETLAWMNNTVHPTFTHVFMPHKFAHSEAAKEEIRTVNAKAYESHLTELDGIVASAKAAGCPWLAGERFGPLDAYTLTLLRWGGFAGIAPTRFASAWAHVQQVAAYEPVARVIERERLVLDLTQPR